MSTPKPLVERLSLLAKRAAAIGVVALLACTAGAFVSPEQFFRSYLIGYLLWIGVALGCMALLMLQHLITGQWGLVGRRSFEAAAGSLWVMVLAFLPLALGLESIYEWAHPDLVTGDALLEHKAPYLNVGFFLLRALLYFAIWLVLASLLNRWSGRQDRGERAYINRFQLASGIGLLLYGLTASFSSVDWVMSIEPHWFSTIYGLQFIAGQMLSAVAFTVLVLLLLSEHEPLRDRIGAARFHDFGNLMLAFVMLWAYLAFSQYLITWSGNLPEEIPWYLSRTRGGWQWIGLMLVVFHFAIPFALLLSRAAKRSARSLSLIAGLILLLRLADTIWLVEPAYVRELSVHWMDILAPVGIGGIWMFAFLSRLKAYPLMPLNDPRFAGVPVPEEALRHEAS